MKLKAFDGRNCTPSLNHLISGDFREKINYHMDYNVENKLFGMNVTKLDMIKHKMYGTLCTLLTNKRFLFIVQK